jgi:membrane-bound lytic murein transglycosylase D
MADILVANGVPPEMIAVVIVESCFKRHASYKGAKGYWQMLAGTARSLGLRVDSWVDERLDPVKSTQAAAKYLRSFYERYQSWALALAAYNAGDGPVSNALKKAHGSDFWEIARSGRLPGHTVSYVPKVFAVMTMLRDSQSQVFGESLSSSLYDFETIRVKSPVRLQEVATWVETPVSEIRELNPSLCQDRVPPNTDFNLRLPSGTRDKFELVYGVALRR